MAPSVILASASTSRAQILRDAGVPFQIESSSVDEAAIKETMAADGAGVDAIAAALAECKALNVAARHADALVIGADQMLTCDGRWFDKPADTKQARSHLKSFSGRVHELITAACVATNDNVIWHLIARAQLTMRPLSDRFIDDYLDNCGESVLGSVGAYRIEGRGAQLFSEVVGSHFTILGLPLLPLLEFLRTRQVLIA